MWTLLLACSGDPVDPPGTDTQDSDPGLAQDQLDVWFAGRASSAGTPGAAAALVRDGELVWVGAWGTANLELGTPVTAETPFLQASVSKTVTGTALLQLIEDGTLSLDEPVAPLLPFVLDNPHVEGEDIRLRHLVTHTSGILDNWDVLVPLYVEGDSPLALEDFLAGYLVEGGDWYDAQANYLPEQPGLVYEYGNVATALAGYLPEATGAPLDEHCEARIFEPLGMEHSGWHLADFDPDSLAMPYWKRAGGNEFEPYGHYGYPDWPDGQLRASAHDMGAFAAAWLNDELITAETRGTAWSPLVEDVDAAQGFFWYRDGPYWAHTGGDSGVATAIYLDPEARDAAVVMINMDWNTGTTAFIEDVLFELLEPAG